MFAEAKNDLDSIYNEKLKVIHSHIRPNTEVILKNLSEYEQKPGTSDNGHQHCIAAINIYIFISNKSALFE